MIGQHDLVGGKASNLAALTRMEGLQVPDGFCIAVNALRRITEENATLLSLTDQLSVMKVDDRDKIAALGAAIRAIIEAIEMPPDIVSEIDQCLSQKSENTAYAVRSSATAEDLPAASFAGQQDTYLNIIGRNALMQHISKCWASLFTERAIIYRIQNRFTHRQVYLAVIVQEMIFPIAAGTMFTADPVNGSRKVVSIDAGFGLGEAVVSGLVNSDVYKIGNGQVIEKKIGDKRVAIHALPAGGTREISVASGQQSVQVLSDHQMILLAGIGKKIEAHFSKPQDIEWCLDENGFHIVQSRPITTIYPIPVENDQENHVYVSVGHQQMMTDAMKPLGLSFWQLTAVRPMSIAGGRLFVDVTMGLATAESRKNLLNVLGQSDPLIKDALLNVLERGDFIATPPDDGKEFSTIKSSRGLSPSEILALAGNDPSVVTALIRQSESSINTLKEAIKTKSGTVLFDFIREDLQQLKKVLFDANSFSVFKAAIDASWWINEKMNAWLGEKNVTDIITQSVPNNITSEMGLALMDVADVVREYPAIVDYLTNYDGSDLLQGLMSIAGGKQVRDAIENFLDKYGMRCPGEIDITKTRWSEHPAALVPILLNNVHRFERGASTRKFEQGLQLAFTKEQEILGRLLQLPDGEAKAEEAKQMISLVRNYIGYREYPKYAKVSRYFIYKQALLKEACKLTSRNIIAEVEDVYYLKFEEFADLVETHKADYDLIRKRKEEYQWFQKLKVPRVLTSDGEMMNGTYKRGPLPGNTLVGLPVSSGFVEGRARVILDLENAQLEQDDILVTRFTDPSWTPLFVAIRGLVTEVGGLMTHGAVIAREYGLPAVVGVDNATRLIQDGQRIRINGTEGYVELL